MVGACRRLESADLTAIVFVVLVVAKHKIV